MFDIAIIGCGVVGCYLAGKLVEKGFKVLAIEEHKQVGYPSKCTGLVSWRIKKLIPDLPAEVLQNKVNKAEFFSPSGSSFSLRSKKPIYVIDRPKLDRFLYKKALNAEIKTGEKFMDFKRRANSMMIETNKASYQTRVLIGADGAYSRVARVTGLKQPEGVLVGLQATVSGRYDEDKVELWFGSKVAPGFFGWVVPISKRKAKVGLATRHDASKYFRKFVGNVKPDTAGIIRYGLMKKTVNDRLLLVGDAACQVKPFSGGGIVYGLIASRIALQALERAFDEEDFSAIFFKENYEDEWKKILTPAIKKGLWIKRLLYLFGDRWIDFLFSLPIQRFIKNWDVDLLDKKTVK